MWLKMVCHIILFQPFCELGKEQKCNIVKVSELYLRILTYGVTLTVQLFCNFEMNLLTFFEILLDYG